MPLLLPLAAAPPQGDPALLALLACGAVGLAVAALVWWVARALQTEDPKQGAEWRYDVSRINELRRVDLFFRLFQPAIELLARLNRAVFRESLPEIQREIQAAGLPRFWLAEEYLARAELIALVLAPVYIYACSRLVRPAGLLLAAASCR